MPLAIFEYIIYCRNQNEIYVDLGEVYIYIYNIQGDRSLSVDPENQIISKRKYTYKWPKKLSPNQSWGINIQRGDINNKCWVL